MFTTATLQSRSPPFFPFSFPKRKLKSLKEGRKEGELVGLRKDRNMSLVEGEIDLVAVLEDFNKTVGPVPSRDAGDLVGTFSIFDLDDKCLGLVCTKCLLQGSDCHHVLVRACVSRER